jgi:tetratricopeptide (TPR) repeat protein
MKKIIVVVSLLLIMSGLGAISAIKKTPQVVFKKASSASMANILDAAVEAYQDGDYDRAVKKYKEALQSDTANPKIHFGLGVSYLALGESDKAVEHLLRSLELNPAQVEAYFSLAYAYKSLGKNKDALLSFRQGLGFDLDKQLPRSAFWNEVVMEAYEDEGVSDHDLNVGNIDSTKPSSLSLLKARDESGNVVINHDERYYKNQVIEYEAELVKNPEDVQLKYKLALTLLKIKDFYRATDLKNEIAKENSELAEDLNERITKLQKQAAK